MKHGKKIQFTITLPEKDGKYVEQLAAMRGIPKSSVVAEAVSAHRQFRVAQLMREGYEEMHPRKEIDGE